MKTRTVFIPMIICLFCLFISNNTIIYGQSDQGATSKLNGSITNAFKLRNLTPAHTSGRIADLEIDPNNRSKWFVGVSSGNVWLTNNAGTTWKPVFENYGSYSIGTIAIDPNNSNIVWLGTGENNAQRSVSKGDGIYKSMDGGLTWTNMGLRRSEHIGKIMIDPRNSNVVYVAAQGSVWAPGGDRGLFKTMDGGATWELVLDISENTGISDIIYDPRDPDVLIVSSYQRRRHPGVLVAGGPDGGAWKTTDGGKAWSRLKNGFPGGDLGRIGLAVSPQNPDVLYALVAGTEQTKGFYRSADMGTTWVKKSDYMVIDAQYYMELYPDPHQFDKVYSVNTFMQVTEDGGKTFKNVNNRNMHVDHHDIEFDPENPNHIWIANDGGLYETFDGTNSWRFFDNLPITQFYRVGIDNDYPFYNVYGGTQDNATWGGPSQTISTNGIGQKNWVFTTGGDGFQTRIDPDDPNIVYSESQYGYLVRFDKKSNERTRIQPQPPKGGSPYRWHWNAPLLISKHNKERLYFAAERVFKSENRGDKWITISGDLSLNRDRNRMKVMDRVWGVDAVFKNVWTSPMGTIVSLTESSLQEGLLYAGTDDGQISMTIDEGQSWKKIELDKKIPENIFIADLHTSPTDAKTVYVVLNNHKFGDYTPYVYKSVDGGQSWKSIVGNLPKEEYLWSIHQDFENPNLLFLGAEYGLYFSIDGGQNWNKFTSGIPTIAIRDLELQQRESDLVTASFGRGFYILDDYSPLRSLTTNNLEKETHLFPVRDALQYVMAYTGESALGDNFFTSANPEYGAVITYHLKKGESTLAQKRKNLEAQNVKNEKPVYYPEWQDLADERMEEKPRVVVTITNSSGMIIDRVSGPVKKGIHRVTWNLKDNKGVMVPPGTYTAQLAKLINGVWSDLGESQSFKVIPLNNSTLVVDDPNEKFTFLNQVQLLRQKADHARKLLNSLTQGIKYVQKQFLNETGLNEQEFQSLVEIEKQVYGYKLSVEGNQLAQEKMELISPSILSRIRNSGSGNSNTSEITQTQLDDYKIALEEYNFLTASYNLLIKDKVDPLSKMISQVNPMLSLPTELMVAH